LAGLIGVELSIVSLISLSAMMVAVSTFSCLVRPPQSQLSAQDQTAQHHLGLMAKAVTQTYALAASTLVALMITIAFVAQFSADTAFSMLNVPFIVGIIIGVVLVLLFCALLIKTVSRVTAGAKQISSSHHAVTQLSKRSQRELLIPVLVPLVLSILIAYLFGNKVVSGLTIGVGFGGLLIGLAALIGGDAWMFVTRYLNYFWSVAKQPTGWDNVTAEQLITDGYRDSIVATLSPLIKMIAIIALLMAV
jgi:K(+)-stimulated pyrophosphate-energized sodium pump